jgi:hypothetical protein
MRFFFAIFASLPMGFIEYRGRAEDPSIVLSDPEDHPAELEDGLEGPASVKHRLVNGR